MRQYRREKCILKRELRPAGFQDGLISIIHGYSRPNVFSFKWFNHKYHYGFIMEEDIRFVSYTWEKPDVEGYHNEEPGLYIKGKDLLFVSGGVTYRFKVTGIDATFAIGRELSVRLYNSNANRVLFSYHTCGDALRHKGVYLFGPTAMKAINIDKSKVRKPKFRLDGETCRMETSSTVATVHGVSEFDKPIIFHGFYFTWIHYIAWPYCVALAL